MKMRLTLTIAAILLPAAFIHAQLPQSQSTPDPGESTRRVRQAERNAAVFETLRAGPNPARDMRLFRNGLKKHYDRLYRDLTDAELLSLSPDAKLRERFRPFLATKGTGLIKLLPTAACSADKLVARADDLCTRYAFPGSGASYSFRSEDYRIRELADITLNDARFTATGDLTQGIYVELGDVSLEHISMSSAAARSIAELRPADNVAEAIRFARELDTGVRRGELVFRRSIRAIPNSTFILRSIAYKGPNYKAIEGITYDEFSFDKRRDTIIAVRVVAVGDDGSVTLLWKRLSEKRAAGPLRAK
jgi:hypothetical protein